MLPSHLSRILDILPGSGECPICKTESRNRCTRCKNIFYCNVEHQKEDWKAHKPSCTPFALRMKEWPVNQLDKGVKKDEVPTGEEVRRDYGFVNCKNAEEETKLLKLYTGLILMLKRDLVRLHEACITGKLKELITAEYEKPRENCPDFGYAWFKENSDIVKNHYPLPDPPEPPSSEPGASTSSAAAAAANPPTTEIKIEPEAEGGAAAQESKPEVKSEPAQPAMEISQD